MGVWLDLLGMVLKSSPAQKALTNVAKEFISRPELVKDVVVGSTKMIISSAALINGLMVLRQTAHVTRLNKFTTRKVAEEQKGTQVEVEALNRRCKNVVKVGILLMENFFQVVIRIRPPYKRKELFSERMKALILD